MLTRRVCITAAAAWLAMLGAALAATGAWTPTSVRGVVVYLLDGRWEEVARGQVLTSATLRTLRSGRVTLAGPDVALEVGPNSALQLALKPDGSGGTIEQYLGTISLAAQQGNGGLTVRAGTVVLTGITGEVSVVIAGTGTSIVVESGTAAITAPGGKKLVLDTGSYSADASGLVVEQAAAAGDDQQSAAVEGAAAAGGGASAPQGGGSENGGSNSGTGTGGGSGANGGGSGGHGNDNGGGNGGNANGGDGSGNGTGTGNGGNGGGNGNGNGSGNSGNANGTGNGHNDGKGNKP